MPRHAPVPGDGLPRAPRTHGPAGASGCSKFEVVPATRSPQTPRTTSYPKRDRIWTNRIESALKRPQQVAGDRRPALAVRKFHCERSRGWPGGTSRGHRKRSTRYRRVRRQAREPARPAVEAQHAPHIPGLSPPAARLRPSPTTRRDRRDAASGACVLVSRATSPAEPHSAESSFARLVASDTVPGIT